MRVCRLYVGRTADFVATLPARAKPSVEAVRTKNLEDCFFRPYSLNCAEYGGSCMKIGINVSRLSGQRLGVGRYLEYMLKYWSTMLQPDEHVFAYLREPVPAESLAHLNISSAIKLQVVKPSLTGLLWENSSMALEARKLDVLFGPSYSLPILLPVPRRRVVATHSVNQAQAGAHNWWHDITYGKRDEYSARTADAVIVPCDSTADLVVELYRVSRQKIFIVPQGADTSFRPLEDREQATRTRIQFLGADVPYVLFVGKLSVRRNIPNLIAAFAQAKRDRQLPHKLLLMGPNHVNLPLQEICREHGVAGDVVQTDGKFTHHEELIRVYNAADLFVHPSWFEGWSMTTIEALACGTATIAANRGGLGDVARGYAYMVDEPSVPALKDAIEKVLLDTKLHGELRRLARQRGSSINWEYTTRHTLDVIRDVARN
jgi:glycosyltransferase involved in cell wall biosynthesis